MVTAMNFPECAFKKGRIKQEGLNDGDAISLWQKGVLGPLGVRVRQDESGKTIYSVIRLPVAIQPAAVEECLFHVVKKFDDGEFGLKCEACKGCFLGVDDGKLRLVEQYYPWRAENVPEDPFTKATVVFIARCGKRGLELVIQREGTYEPEERQDEDAENQADVQDTVTQSVLLESHGSNVGEECSTDIDQTTAFESKVQSTSSSGNPRVGKKARIIHKSDSAVIAEMGKHATGQTLSAQFNVGSGRRGVGNGDVADKFYREGSVEVDSKETRTGLDRLDRLKQTAGIPSGMKDAREAFSAETVVAKDRKECVGEGLWNDDVIGRHEQSEDVGAVEGKRVLQREITAHYRRRSTGFDYEMHNSGNDGEDGGFDIERARQLLSRELPGHHRSSTVELEDSGRLVNGAGDSPQRVSGTDTGPGGGHQYRDSCVEFNSDDCRALSQSEIQEEDEGAQVEGGQEVFSAGRVTPNDMHKRRHNRQEGVRKRVASGEAGRKAGSGEGGSSEWGLQGERCDRGVGSRTVQWSASVRDNAESNQGARSAAGRSLNGGSPRQEGGYVSLANENAELRHKLATIEEEVAKLKGAVEGRRRGKRRVIMGFVVGFSVTLGVLSRF